MIYLDNSATTRLDDAVLEEMLPWFQHGYGNASSIYSLGRQARVAVEDARNEIAALLNGHPAEVIFTSGGTESNNTVLKSCCSESDLVDRVVCGASEHHAILEPVAWLNSQGKQTFVHPVDAEGRVSIEGLREENRVRTLVSIMHANNETGVVNDLHSIREAIPDALLHTDAVQSFGKIPLDVQALGIDFLSVSAHKIHGPKGVGALFIRKGIDFKAHQQGGAQERNRRSGTEAVALIVGFAVAARRAVSEMNERAARMTDLLTLLRERISTNVPQISVNTPLINVLPNVLNISFPDAESFDGDAVLQGMDLRGVAVSNGSACVSGSLQPSHVLMAMGRSVAESRAAVRFSVSKDTTRDEIETASAILSDIVRDLRSNQ
ncbi:MAG: cysteine desulfurase family protein [bacterium]|nr:cysteine desulfurase family protein [bacterium]